MSQLSQRHLDAVRASILGVGCCVSDAATRSDVAWKTRCTEANCSETLEIRRRQVGLPDRSTSSTRSSCMLADPRYAATHRRPQARLRGQGSRWIERRG